MNSPDSLLRQRSFVLFWCARVAATMANQMLAVAIGWQLYDLTGSALNLGLVGLVQFVPVVPLSLFVGHVADRYDRRLVVRTCQIVECLSVAGLALASGRAWLDVSTIFAAVFAVATARTFELPTMHAMVPNLVPQPLFARAVAGSTSANQLAVIVGPALGGVLYAAGPTTVYSICAGCFLLASVLVTLIPRQPAPAERSAPRLDSLLAGIAFIRERPALRGVILLDLFAVILGGATALLPVYARDILQTGPWGLGLLRLGPAAGALLASLVLTHYPLRRMVGRIMFAAVIAFGLATMGFAVSTTLAVALGALMTLGAADSVSVVIRFALVQTETPDALRGRVSAVNYAFVGASNTLGDFRAGLMGDWLGAVPAVLIGGFGTVLTALLCMRLFPSLLRVESLESKTR
jgi:MFS family permease